MKYYNNPKRATWSSLCERPVFDFSSLESRVQEIIDTVKSQGDKALFDYTKRFDGVELKELQVTKAEFKAASSRISVKLKTAIRQAIANVRTFHESQAEESQKIETMPGVTCWRKSIAIEKVGLYIPGGTAPLFSTVLMLGVPAKLAGCKEIVLCTPPSKQGEVHPAMLFTAQEIGIEKVFKVGGAQAVAAMAVGTESIPKVEKIFGPGNQYVTMAKQLVAKTGFAIDLPAGPSEVAVLGDESANVAFVAADLLSQAEHGVDSQVVLVSTCKKLLEKIPATLEEQVAQLPREEIARKCLENSVAIYFDQEDDAIDFLNQYAAEHLILSIENDEEVANKIQNAGSIFLGHYSPESVGDYASGTNHTLPTNGCARAFSGVSLDSFVKKITYQKLSKQGLLNIGKTVEIMAAAEELQAHKNAVSIRLATM